MNTIGIDQSYTSTGYCVIGEDKQVIAFGRIKSTVTSDMYDRAIEISDALLKLIKEHNCSKVQMEGLAFGMIGNATRDLAGLIYVIITSIRRSTLKPTITIYTPTQVKKTATGSGKAKKPDMINALPEDIKQKFIDSGLKKTSGLPDVTDAYWIAQCKVNPSIAT